MAENLVTVAEGSLEYIKQLVAQCQEVGIEASMERCRKKT